MTTSRVRWLLAPESPYTQLKVDVLSLIAEFGLGPDTDITVHVWDGLAPEPGPKPGPVLHIGRGPLKDPRPEMVYGALVAVLMGIDLGGEATLAPEQQGVQLSPRETHILRLVATGLPNKAIAVEAGVSISTVKFHIQNILDKFGVQSRTEAVLEGIRRGVVPV